MFRAPADRPPPDTRDDQEKADVARILAVLPPEHAARQAHESGTDTLRLTQLVADPDLTEAFLAGRNRVFRRAHHFRP